MGWRLVSAVVTFFGLMAGPGIASAGTTTALRPVVLPRDHGAHPGFNIEWWYTAGTLTGANGRDYFWFATIWSGGTAEVAKVNVVDLDADRIVLSHEYIGTTAYRSGQTQLGVGAFQLGWRPHGSRGKWSIDAPADAADRLDLDLSPVQPYVLHGHNGIIRQGPGGRSAYYSAPRLSAGGTLELDGKPVRVRGQGWLDHQWGNFGTDTGALRWNWFACQFRNGSDLMLYQFLNAKDHPSGSQNGTFVDPNGTAKHLSRFTVVALGPVIKPAGARAAYPLRWRLQVPSGSIDITVKARARHQFIVNQYVPSFWEGAASITKGLPGECIVESSREVAAITRPVSSSFSRRSGSVVAWRVDPSRPGSPTSLRGRRS
jgi:predicted secreted hydrolase